MSIFITDFIKMGKEILKKIGKSIIHFLNILLIILSLALALIAIFKKEWFTAFIEWMKIFVEGLGYFNYLIAFISSLIEAFPVIGVVVPGQNILLIVGGFFGSISSINLFYVILVAILGAIFGNYIGFLLGRYYGDSFFEKYGVWFGIGKTEVKYLKVGIDKWGPLGITLGKFHPMTRSFLPFIAGSMKMKSVKFMIYNIIGSIIRAITIILLGVVFVNYYKFLVENAGTISIIIFAIIGLYIYKFKKEEFKKYWNEKNAEMEEIARKK